MEEILSQAFSTGDIKIVIVAVILYVIIHIQRKQTGTKRDEDTDSINTRITLLEADNKLLHTQLDTIGNKLDKIIDQLSDIRVSLANKKDKEN
jgi:uncharacterized membrane protein